METLLIYLRVGVFAGLFGVVAASALFGPLGAWLAHRLPGET